MSKSKKEEKTFTWKSVAAMKDRVIGALLNTSENNACCRGPIESITVGKSGVILETSWTEVWRQGDGDESGWQFGRINSMFVDIERQPRLSEDGNCIHFTFAGGSGSIYLDERDAKQLHQPKPYDRDRDAHC